MSGIQIVCGKLRPTNSEPEIVWGTHSDQET